MEKKQRRKKRMEDGGKDRKKRKRKNGVREDGNIYRAWHQQHKTRKKRESIFGSHYAMPTGLIRRFVYKQPKGMAEPFRRSISFPCIEQKGKFLEWERLTQSRGY